MVVAGCKTYTDNSYSSPVTPLSPGTPPYQKSSKGCGCGKTEGDTLYFSGDTLIVALETHEKYRAIADVLSSSDYKILREFLMENVDVRQNIPGAEAGKIVIEGKEVGVYAYIPFEATSSDIEPLYGVILKVFTEDKSTTMGFIWSENEPFSPDLVPFSVFVDPCWYMQQDGDGCNTEPFYMSIMVMDSTGIIVPPDPVSYSWLQDCFAPLYDSCASLCRTEWWGVDIDEYRSCLGDCYSVVFGDCAPPYIVAIILPAWESLLQKGGKR